MGETVLKLALAYIEKHPEVLEELVKGVISRIVDDLKSKRTDKPADKVA